MFFAINTLDGKILTNPGAKTQVIQPQTTLVPTTQPKIPETLEIGTLNAILGIAAILIAAGGAWGSLKSLVKDIKNTLDNTVKPDLKDVRERFGIVEDRVDTIWKDKFAPSNSPRQLNDKGENILKNSGIKEIIEEKKVILLEEVKKKKPKTAYDAELIIHSIVSELPKHCPDMTDRLKEGAFNVGQSVGVILFVGGIYLRNLIFKDLGFSLDDLDDKKEEVKK